MELFLKIGEVEIFNQSFKRRKQERSMKLWSHHFNTLQKMEPIIKDQIVDLLTKNSLLNKSRHEFMKIKSCVLNLMEFFEKVTFEIDIRSDQCWKL